MRKAQKEQITNIIRLLEKAHKAIQKNIEKHYVQPVMDLLRDCQEAAIAIGSQIEKTEGVGFSTVCLLEKYCELSYQLYENIKLVEVEKENIQNCDGIVQAESRICGESENEIQKVAETGDVENWFIEDGTIWHSENMSEQISSFDNMLSQIADSVEHDITIRKEAVFLPYKASMWDSLESVWKAADEDPN